MTAPTRRVNRGRGHSYFLDGAPADGVTWVLGNGVPKPALVDWAARTTAGYAIDHWDELGGLGMAERLRTLERARWDSTREAAVRGTDVHALAHRLAAGEEVDVPEPLRGHVDSYLRFAEEWQPREFVAEATIGNRQWRYMGTLDVVAGLADGRVWLLDWKTSGKGIYRESALQLAAYRNAEFILNADGSEVAMPKVDACGCVWLRADGYDLIPVAADEEAFRTFLYAMQVARFTSADSSDYIGEALTPPERTAAA
jgi:hypothetical protein